MQLNNALRNGQAQPASAGFPAVGILRPVETVKNALTILRRNIAARVMHPNPSLPSVRLQRQGNGPARASVLNGVG